MNRLCCSVQLMVAIAGFDSAAAALAQTTRQPRDVHVVVVVFDGLRPDSMAEQDMPNLYAPSGRRGHGSPGIIRFIPRRPR